MFALKGEVQASIPVGVATIEGNASINLSDSFSKQNVSTVTNYTAIGWNKKFDENGAILPPQVCFNICSFCPFFVSFGRYGLCKFMGGGAVPSALLVTF